ncbi:MAG: AAA family ATPase [bacterium]
MKATTRNTHSVARIEFLKVQNYRALQNLELRGLTPLTVFLGPNGSGKSTIFDVFAFLSECFSVGLRKAWDKRGRFVELRTRGATGFVVFELKYREAPDKPLITYHLAIDEENNRPFVAEEWLQWKRGSHGRPFHFLDFKKGIGEVISTEMPEENDKRSPEKLESPDMLAVNTLGQLSKHPRVVALRRFITDWYLSYLSSESARRLQEAGPQERLSQTGDNLPNVIQYLSEQHKDRLERIKVALSRRIPRLEKVDTSVMADGRLLLQIKDTPFERPILAKYTSDGTLKMLAYLIILYDPNPPQLIGIEEPENQLHPRLLPGMTEECRHAANRSQVLVTSHSSHFINELRPEELWVLYRDKHGYTKARQTSKLSGITDLVNDGAKLGDLWTEGQFNVGDPLRNAGDEVQTDLFMRSRTKR